MYTPLHEAAFRGSVEGTLDVLKIQDDVDVTDSQGWTALMIAADEGYLRVARILLRFGADVSLTNVDGLTCLHLAIVRRHLAVCRALIRAGSDLGVGADCCLNNRGIVVRGHTPLHMAANSGFCGAIVALLAAGANANSRLDNGATPLYLAACCGSTEAVGLLLRANADPLLTVGVNFPLDVAAQEGRFAVIRELLAHFGLRGCSTDNGTEALEAAAFTNNGDIAEFLIQAGAVDTRGNALCAAVEGKAEACVKTLLKLRGGHWNTSEAKYCEYFKGHG